MACTTLQRRWIVRCGLLVGFVWFLLSAYWLKHDPLIPLNGLGVNKMSSSNLHPESNDELGRNQIELTMRAGDPRTIIKQICPKDNEATLKRCAKLKFDSLGPLPNASIIITFHNSETISSLLHTIHSIVQRTPEHLLEEIIVIDDCSQKDDFGQILEIYLETVFRSSKISLHRNAENVGLIRSRLRGSRLSKGQVLVFMDSHSEVQIGWLEPLLFEIKKNRRSLVNSVVDWMEKTEENRWRYRYGCTFWTVIYDWSMGFGWGGVPSEETRGTITDAYKSKTIIGTYAAIDKEFFREIGEMDDGMGFWGAENIDLSIRVWLFDGQVLTVPCSRAAHLEGNNTRAYREGHQSTVLRNYKRLAEVWFDEYKDCFYYYFPQLISVDAGDLSERLRVKASAPHNFNWYLQNIYPELGCPVKDVFAQGLVKNLGTGWCILANQYLTTTECPVEARMDHKIYWSNRFHLRQPNYALQAKHEGAGDHVLKVEYMSFYRNDGVTKWIHWKDGPLMDMKSMLCAEALSDGSVPPSTPLVVMRSCNFLNNTRQTWRFQTYTDQYEDLVANNQLAKIHRKEQKVFLKIYNLYR